MDLYEAIDAICNYYCKYPDIESGNNLADICDKCPMNRCEDLRWADRKTESSSENSNNCETCLYRNCPWDAPICDSCTLANSHYERDEFVKDTNVRCKEPQIDWHYSKQDGLWYPYKHEDEPQISDLGKLLKESDEQAKCPWRRKE